MITEILNFMFVPILEEFGKQNFVIFISFLLVILSSLVYKQLTPQDKVLKLRQEMAKLIADLRNHIGNEEIFNRINSELSDKKLKITSYTILPTIVVVIPMFAIFPWMSSIVPGAIIVLFGIEISWLFIYIVLSLLSNWLVRRAIGA